MCSRFLEPINQTPLATTMCETLNVSNFQTFSVRFRMILSIVFQPPPHKIFTENSKLKKKISIKNVNYLKKTFTCILSGAFKHPLFQLFENISFAVNTKFCRQNKKNCRIYIQGNFMIQNKHFRMFWVKNGKFQSWKTG